MKLHRWQVGRSVSGRGRLGLLDPPRLEGEQHAASRWAGASAGSERLGAGEMLVLAPADLRPPSPVTLGNGPDRSPCLRGQ